MSIDNAQQLNKLAQIFNADKIITTQDIEEVLQALIKVLANNKQSVEQLSSETKQQVIDLFEKIAESQYKLQQKVTNEMEANKTDLEKRMADMYSMCEKMVEDCKMAMPMDGKDANPEDVVPLVMEQIKLPEYEKFILEDKGAQIVGLINDLEITPELQIDAKHIKNLPKFEQRIVNSVAKKGEVLYYDLSSQLDGSTKTFSLPAFYKIIDVRSSSAPFAFIQGTDFTVDGSAMTISFTAQIDATITLATGQTLYILYTTL